MSKQRNRKDNGEHYMMKEELKIARTGFMREVMLSQEEFDQKQTEIIKGIMGNISPYRRQVICNIYGSLEAYEAVLRTLTNHEVDIQKGLVEVMMENVGIENEDKWIILEQMYGESNVCYEEAEYIDDDDNYVDDDCIDDDDDDEYYDDDDDEYVDDDDEYYDDDDEYYDDDDEYYDDNDEEFDFEEEIYLDCMECYMFEDDVRYDMPNFQEKLDMIRQILNCREEYSVAEETKLCLDMGTILDMPSNMDVAAVKEIPVEFSYEMKSAAIDICKRFEKLLKERATIQYKSKILVTEIARKSDEDAAHQQLLEELIEKGSEYQLQRLFMNLEK